MFCSDAFPDFYAIFRARVGDFLDFFADFYVVFLQKKHNRRAVQVKIALFFAFFERAFFDSILDSAHAECAHFNLRDFSEMLSGHNRP